MLEKNIIVDRIEVLPDTGHVQVRQRVSIVEDGAEISSTYHRYVLSRGDDLSGQPAEVAAIAAAAWA